MNNYRSLVLISNNPESIQAGSQALYETFITELRTAGLIDQVNLRRTAGLEVHKDLPIVIVYPEAVVYASVTPEDVATIVDEHLTKGQIVQSLAVPEKNYPASLAWLKSRKGTLPAEKRIVLERAGLIDPEKIEDYIAHNGYQALAKVLTEMQPADLIAELEKSGLQGRGGAGFPAGRKMKFVAAAPGSPKYVICNADESEPGTFKDRLVIEGDPHSIVESLIIAAYAVGAAEGYIYIRGEYGLGFRRLQHAIEQAEEFGFLGENILGSGFSFKLHIHAGAGAYICGEETALIESIEGKRGEPRSRPPYPPTYGLWGMPTLVNNVETLANIPAIIRHGAEWYNKIGTPSSHGTKVFTLFGNVNKRGVVELPMGITLREIIAIYGEGMKDNAPLKLFQTGGSSGSIVPGTLQDVPMDFDAFKKAGVSLGSGAMLVVDENTCVVDLAKSVLQFFRFESCGKCTPCRIGTARCYEIIEVISQGQGKLEDIDSFQRFGQAMEQFSNCGLGQTAWVAIRDIIKHFRGEIEAHIRLGVCPLGICSMEPEPAAAEFATEGTL
jgi:NADP-reducing hydrogenase subunit HndC